MALQRIRFAVSVAIAIILFGAFRPSALRDGCIKCGDGRWGEVRGAAHIPAGMAGDRGEVTAFALAEDGPASLCKGAPEAFGGRVDFARSIVTLRKQGVALPPKLNSTALLWKVAERVPLKLGVAIALRVRPPVESCGESR